MKVAAFILVFLMIALTIAPTIAANCEVKENCCLDECCKKESPQKESKKENRDCNPFTNCPYCNLFIVTKFFIHSPVIIVIKDQFHIWNDNRIVSNLSECWHPPNVIS